MLKSRKKSRAIVALPIYNLPTTIILIVAASLCFSNSYDGNFVFDDTEAIVNNDDVKDKTPLLQIFQNDFWGTNLSSKNSHKSYRPLTTLTFRWHYLVKGELDPADFHIANILLHTVVCILTFFVFEILLEWKEPLIALSATLLFTVHPVHTEAVSGIVGRADVLSALFMWLSIICYYKGVHTNCMVIKYNCILLCILNSCAAMFCKETGITVLGICIVYDIIVVNKILPADILKLTRLNYTYQDVKKYIISNLPFMVRCTVLSLSSIFLIVLRFSIMKFTSPTFQPGDNPAAFLNNFILRIINYNYIYCMNVWILLCPDWLCFDWSMGCIPLIKSIEPRILCIIAFWLFIVVFMRFLFSKTDEQLVRYTIMGLALAVIPFLPASNLFFTVGFVLAERTLFVPSAGYCFLFAVGLRKVSKIVTNSRIIAISYCALLLIFSSRSWIRSNQWRNETTLFQSGLKVCPLNAKVHYNVAKVAADKGLVNYSKSEYQEALRLNPKYPHAMNNLGNIYKNEQHYEEAEKLFRAAIDIQKDFPAAWMNLGIVLAVINKNEEAEKCYITAIKYRNIYPDCYYNLGLLYLANRNLQKAKEVWEITLKQNPYHKQAWTNLVLLLEEMGQSDEALSYAEEALSYIPNDPAIHFNIGNILGKDESFKKAEYHFKTAIAGDLKNAVYHVNLGVLYHRWKKYDKAEMMYKKALKLNPHLNSAKVNLNKLNNLKLKLSS
ncbi:transmembrane and TPR repeat-containing protein 4-like [Trichogramma pretiosum]|uniref:transmembrane and TPR repeat-containing protein 4-like n=1 Tax=Trichogramma pretiosum TaxID=7493 RepID=UPI0006C9DD02|nr:transmembrane and TPR repeat-containing protein 4-like [Trichogramma pretiosum]